MPNEAQKTAPSGADRWLVERITAVWELLTGRPVSLYAASVLRIGYGLLYLTRQTQVPVLTMLLGMHIGIAVLMGLPLFSGG
ncbi:hypothetical protein [Streptomyces caelestis]|jgi:hypothetical protein|uniref:Uncharacterized protein n=1 Tax=Streptomyces caelestis TaxID=36816 RepID=A0A7W9H5B6_9ACTN|nr:hypothetical protein [Streptomyces caelestis]GGW75016.1 hypothetical protein GCM10010320_66220 [Streptomyces caelestis]